MTTSTPESATPRAWTVDLSTELAEGFVLDPCGIPTRVLQDLVLPGTERRFHPRQIMKRADEVLLPAISSAYLACGAHSGDPLVVRRLLPALLERGIRVGAHPSYPDIFDFGQHRVSMAPDELVSVILYQLGALQGVLREFGERIRYVKCHGALYFDVAAEDWACDALLKAVEIFDPEIIVVAPFGASTGARLEASGLRIAREVFADRGYDGNGQILPRSHPNALLSDATDVANRIVSVVKRGVLNAADGSKITMHADTFCLHSDTPGAADMVSAVMSTLGAEGIRIAPTADFL